MYRQANDLTGIVVTDHDLTGIVVAHHDVTGIVVGVTLFEPCVVCEDRIRDSDEGADRGQLCSGVTPRELLVTSVDWCRDGKPKSGANTNLSNNPTGLGVFLIGCLAAR